MSPIFMTLALLVGWGVFAWSALRRWKLLSVGTPAARFDRVGERVSRTFAYAFAQKRMPRYTWAGIAHLMIFVGFGVLLLRTLILWGRGYSDTFSWWLFDSDDPLGKAYNLLKDIFASLVVLGTLVFVYYRVVKRLKRMSLTTEGLIILGIILAMMCGDFVYDGAWLNLHPHGEVVGEVAAPTYSGWEPVGSSVAVMFHKMGLSEGTLTVLAHLGFWTHSLLVLLFLNLLPYSKHFHVITAIPNVFFQELAPRGQLRKLEDIEGMLEREETLGVRRIDQFSWKSILDFYTCTECGRCSDHCPATKTGKKLSPKHLTIDLRNFLYDNETDLVAANGSARSNGDGESGGNGSAKRFEKDLVPDVIDPEVLWACTTCGACETECPVFITYVDKIVDMRRYLVQEKGEMPPEWEAAFRSLETNMNPYSSPPDERTAWTEGLDVPTIADNPNPDVLFWVGCAPAYDQRARKIARSTAVLLKEAGVNFAILGQEEQCTGDPARRAGNEFLFQMLADANVEILNGYEVKKIVTTCPHCFNTLLNEYPDFGGKYEVVHHSQYLAQLVSEGRLKPTNRVEAKVAYHDSCYLGRYNDIYDSPRDVLTKIPGVTLVEPAETRDRGMCCGAGGAQMFKEEEEGSERVNLARVDQLTVIQPDTVATACPFCMRMLSDGLVSREKEEIKQLDVAELLCEAVTGTQA
jgi:Fe-S oxidoreductase